MIARSNARRISSTIVALLMTAVAIGNSGCSKDNDEGSAPPPQATLRLVTDGLVSPITLVSAPDNSGRRFVVDQVGKIWVITAEGRKLPEPFLDISSRLIPMTPELRECGLLGLAFHPDYKNNGKFYVYYSVERRPGGPAFGVQWNHANRLSEFRFSSFNPNVADPNSERVILTEDWPGVNHNGGCLAFGPDGYLYLSMGDGGGQNDAGAGHVDDWYATNAGGNAQNISANLLGKLLRIDVNQGTPYGIPASNPFATTAGVRPEIYAFGFRNPYHFSFDMGGAHELYLADVGQAMREELNVVTSGGNYGWNVKEGSLCFNTDNNTSPRASCPSTDGRGIPLTDPVLELNNSSNPLGGIATAIIGGYVYRGAALPQLQGSYIFGSYSQTAAPDGMVYVSPRSAGQRSFQPLQLHGYETGLHQYINGFGQDAAGEVYILSSDNQAMTGATGKVYQIVPVQ